MKSITILLPHDDDAIIGMGGTILRLLKKGWDVHYIQMTDGRHGTRDESPELIKKLRAEEARAEVEYLGIASYTTMDVEDGKLAKISDERRAEIVRNVAELIKSHGSEVVFIPCKNDAHTDHRATYQIGVNAISTIGGLTSVEYYVWLIPGRTESLPHDYDTMMHVEINDSLEEKLKVIRLHKCQEGPGRYSEMAKAFNRAFGLIYSEYDPIDVGYVEVFSAKNLNASFDTLVADLERTKLFHRILHGRKSEEIL